MRIPASRGYSRMHPPRHSVLVRSFSSFSSSNYVSPPKTPRATLALTFALGSAVGAAVAYTFTSRQKNGDVDVDDGPRTALVAPEAPEPVEHDALKHGWPLAPDAVIHSKPSYACAFDGKTRNSRWVLEKITLETLNGPGTRKKSDFYEDEAVSWKHRATLNDYRGSGYDRGHLVPAADQKGSQSDMDATFSLMNVSPQVGAGFNRDYWAKLEEFVRDAVSDGEGRVAYVVTGPLFLPSRRERNETAAVATQTSSGMPKRTEWEMRHPMLGDPPALVSVPTHFYKVVLVEDDSKRVACAAFVLPNAPIPKHIPLRRFVVPLTDLEIVSGLEFFKRGLLGADRSSYERAEHSFLASTAKQLPGSGKIPSLPASSSHVGRSSDDGIKVVGKRWADVKHLCDVVACEIPAKSKWERQEEAKKLAK